MTRTSGCSVDILIYIPSIPVKYLYHHKTTRPLFCHLFKSFNYFYVKERQFKDINTCSSKTSSPGSSVMSSWCNAGESLAANDFSNLSISSSEDSNKQDNKMVENRLENEHKLSFDLNDDDLVTLNTDLPTSTICKFAC